jgi:hypothetical protein
VRDGGRCVRPTCGGSIAEIDHTDDYRWTKHTTVDDLARRGATPTQRVQR